VRIETSPCFSRNALDKPRERLEGQAIVIKYFFFLHLLQPTLAPRIIRMEERIRMEKEE